MMHLYYHLQIYSKMFLCRDEAEKRKGNGDHTKCYRIPLFVTFEYVKNQHDAVPIEVIVVGIFQGQRRKRGRVVLLFSSG